MTHLNLKRRQLAPSPSQGEGWGEGESSLGSKRSLPASTLTPTLSLAGRGSKTTGER